MNDRRPTQIYRKIIIGVSIAAVGLTLAGIILISVLQQAQEIQEAQEASQAEEIQEVQQVQKAQGGPQAEEIREVRQVQEVRQGQEVQLVDIIPSPTIIRLDQAGVSQRLSVQGYYSDGSVKELEYDSGTPFSYMPSDSTVVQIDSYGVVTGLKAGGADIVIGYGRFTATVPVLVWGPVRRVPPIDPNRLLEVSDDGTSIVLNRVMAKLEPGYGTTDAGHVASRIGGEIIFEYRTFPGYVIEFDANTEDDLENALVVLKADPRVSHVYPDIGMLAASPWTSKEDPKIDVVASDCYRKIETLCFLSRDKKMAYLDAGMENAWKTIDQVHKLDPVTIAVLDTDFAIPPTGDNETDKIITREFDLGNIHVQDLVPGVGSHKHGVAVTSVIVAANNARPDHIKSFSGVATSVDKLDYNLIFYALGDNGGVIEEHNLVTAFQLINNLEGLLRHKEQIDVVNISLAIKCHKGWALDRCDLNDGWVKELKALMKQMPEITFVVAAGNAVTNIDNRTVIPASLSTLDNVITVGGVSRDATTTWPTKNFQWWSGEKGTEGSNYGKGVTLGAPAEVWAVNSGPPGQYALHKGTSFAAPMVTGTVALMKALKPAATPAEIKKILVQTGDINHGVCKNPAERRCAKLPILDAGAALVEEVDGEKIVDIKARISSATPTLIETWPGNTAIAISAENTGSHGAFFIMKGNANNGGTPSKLHMDKSETILLLPKDSSSFRLDFPVKMDGELKVNVGIYSSHDPTIALDSHKLTIESVAAPTTATASTATPAPTGTPSPRPTPTQTTVPSPQPTSAPIAVPNLRTMPAPTVVPTAQPAPAHIQQGTWMTPEEESLLTNFFTCVHENPAFKETILVLTATELRPNAEAALEDWDLFQLTYMTLFREDPTAGLVIERMIPQFCDTNPRTNKHPAVAPTPTPERMTGQHTMRMTPEEERLMTDFYNCVQESLAFKLTVGTLTALGDLANPPPGAVLDDWNLFLPYYLTLFRADPEAEQVIEGMIPLFCDKG